MNYITFLNFHVWNCVYLGKVGADSDTDEETDGGDKTGGDSVSQWVKDKTLKFNLRRLNNSEIFHEKWSYISLKDPVAIS